MLESLARRDTYRVGVLAVGGGEAGAGAAPVAVTSLEDPGWVGGGVGGLGSLFDAVEAADLDARGDVLPEDEASDGGVGDGSWDGLGQLGRQHQENAEEAVMHGFALIGGV